MPAAAPPRRSIVGNSLWAVAGTAAQAAAQWLIFVLVAKGGSADAVGQLALGFAVAAPVALFFNLGLRTLQTTDSKGEFRFGTYVRLRALSVPLAWMTVAAFSVLAPWSSETRWVVLAVAGAKVAESLSDVLHGRLQQHERLDLVSRSQVLRGVATAAATVFALALSPTAVSVGVGLIVAWTLVLVLYDVPRALRTGIPHAGEGTQDGQLKRLLRNALPLGGVAMLISLGPSVPRYFLSLQWTERELGLFGAAASLSVATGLVINSLGQASAPRLSRLFADGARSHFLRLLGRLGVFAVLYGAACVGGALLLGEQVLSIAFTPEYAAETTTLVWLMVGAAVQHVASVLWYALSATRRFKVQLPLFLTTTAVAVVASAVLIPARGTLGAAFAVVAMAVVQLAGTALLLARALRPVARESSC